MIKRALVASLTFLAISAQAVTFSSVRSDVTAVALSDGSPDFQSASSPPTSISASAASFGVDVATAGSVADSGLMSTSADVSGIGGGVVSAVATSHFLGTFANAGLLLFDIGYTPSSFSSGSGSGSTTLFMTLMSGATILFSDYVTTSRLFSYAAAAGATGSLELTLTSDASAGFASTGVGSYSSTGQVTFATPVPEPGTSMLLLAGLVAVSVAIRRRPSGGR